MAIVCHKGKCLIRGKRDGSVWRINKVNPNKMKHPTEKPAELIERLILKYSDEDDIVLDPFIGSGTTAEACIKTNRHYIGYEIDSTYFELAQNRLENIKLQYPEGGSHEPETYIPIS